MEVINIKNVNNNKFKIGDLLIANQTLNHLQDGYTYKVVGYGDMTDEPGVRTVKVKRFNPKGESYERTIGGFFEHRFDLYKKHRTIKKII